MRIALLQHNPTVGDLAGNAARLRELLALVPAGTDVVVTPEMALTGYPPRDLLLQSGFVEACERQLHELAAQTRGGPVLVVGAPLPSGRQQGRPLVNAAVVLRNGVIEARHPKSLLPTYDVFDEDRYFEAGNGIGTLEVGGERVALSVCEDVWNDPDLWSAQRYAADPMAGLKASGVQVLLNMSASPYESGKQAQRERLLGHLARKYGVWACYANQAGANDDLIFDGRSLAMAPDGRRIARGPSFGPGVVLVDTSAGDARVLGGSGTLLAGPAAEAAADDLGTDADLFAALVLGVRDYARKCGFSKAVLGLSGGVDSALCAVIAAEALGPANVTGILMPSPYSSQHSLDDALALAAALGMPTMTVPIAPMMAAYDGALSDLFAGLPAGVTEENVQARIRGALLMAWSNKLGAMLLTTGNKSELATGYCTLYGDMCGALAVIADVYKTRVYALSRWVNREREVIPESTLVKPPSAELRPNQTDQDSLPPYELLDAILTQHIEGHADRERLLADGFDEAVVTEVLHLVRVAEFKRRQAAPALKVSSRAFGTGWRMPVARGRWV